MVLDSVEAAGLFGPWNARQFYLDAVLPSVDVAKTISMMLERLSSEG